MIHPLSSEEEIKNAILSKKIAGVGCDVYSSEPMSKTHPFQELLNKENVILTPHMAWASFESRRRCLSEVYKNIVEFFNGSICNRVDL